MKKKILNLSIIAIFVAIALFLGQTTSFAEGEGSTEPFDYTFEINFHNTDGTDWEFDEYSELKPLKIVKDDVPFGNIEYTYSWSNGDNGNGITDEEGKINITPTSTEKSNKVSITLKNIPNSCNVKIPLLDKKVYKNGTVDGNELLAYTDYNRHAYQDGTDVAISAAGTSKIEVNKAEEPLKVNMKFYHEDGSEWVLQRNNFLYYNFLSIENTPNVVESVYKDGQYYKWDFNSGKTIEYNYFATDGVNENPYLNLMVQHSEVQQEAISGSSAITLNCTGIEDSAKLKIQGAHKDDAVRDFSKVLVNGEEVNNEGKELNIKPGDTINIDYYIPETSSGTVSLYSYDGSLSDDYVYHFFFENEVRDSFGNQDANDMYWTLEGDNTKHYAVPRSEEDGANYEGNYVYKVAVPVGKTVTLHGIPYRMNFHNADNWVHGDYDAAYSEHDSAVYGLTYKGEYLTREDLKALNINEHKYSVITAPSTGEDRIFTSGGFFVKDGFDVKHYIFRENTQIMFKKEYGENIDIEEKDKEFHYRVKLTDPLTKMPLKGKVAYYIYSQGDKVADDKEDVKYAELDDNGYIDIYLKAGEYVRIGKMMTEEELATKELRGRLDGVPLEDMSAYSLARLYFNDLGMLPLGVEYSIEEVDDDYSYVVDTEGAENGTGTYEFKEEYETYLDKNAEGWYKLLNGFKFTNSRKTGSLTIEKIVDGELSDKEFKFNIKLTDRAEKFPLVYDFENSNGNKGKIKFIAGNKVEKEGKEFREYTAIAIIKAGEKVTISGIPAGAEYEVTEDDESAEGYTTEVTGATGKIKADGNDEKSVASFVNKEIVEEKEEDPQEEPKQEVVEEKVVEEVKQVQTGDVIVRVAAVLAMATVALVATCIKKKN